MPVYPIKCKNPQCGASHEVFSRVSECHMLRCPDCGSVAEQDYAAKGRTLHWKGDELHDMSRRELLTEGVSPDEAPRKAKELEPFGLSHVYQKNGDCVVSGKSEMKALARAKKELRKRSATSK